MQGTFSTTNPSNKSDENSLVMTSFQNFFTMMQNQLGGKNFSRTSNTNEISYDKDPNRTGIKKFDMNQTDTDIFFWIKNFQDHVSDRFNTDEQKKEALLERLTFDSKQFLKALQDIDSMDYAELLFKVCEAFGGANAEAKKYNDFRNVRKRPNEKMENFTIRAIQAWNNYNFCRQVHDKQPENDRIFLETFLTLLEDKHATLSISLAISSEKIETTKDLQAYMHNHGKSYDPIQIDTSTQAQIRLQHRVAELEKQLRDVNKKNQSLDTGSFAVTNIQQESTRLQQKIDMEQNIHNSRALEDAKETTQRLTTMVNNLQNSLLQTRAESQKHQNELQQQARVISNLQQITQENNAEKPYKQREWNPRYNNNYRGRSPSPQRNYSDNNRYNSNYKGNNNYNDSNRHNNNYGSSRGNNHNDNNKYNNNYGGYKGSNDNYRQRSRSPSPYSARSRSPSPTPMNSKCFACGEAHWMVSCPYLTREERETELFKIINKIVKKDGSITKEKETSLRNTYNIPATKPNQSKTHDESKDPPGRGHFCKWCYVRGHSMFICQHYCPICETKGHGWETCNKDATLVATRKQKLATLLQRFKLYSSN